MTATLTQARDEMLGAFKAAWDVGGQGVLVIYEGQDGVDPPEPPTPYVRVVVRHNPVQPGEVTLAGADGTRRYRRIGLVMVQLFAPLGDGLALSDTLTTVAQGAFQGVSTVPGDVIFRAVSASEVGRRGGWYQTNVTAQFEYDEIA